MRDLPTIQEAPRELTQSSLSAFLSCPMKYFFRYRLGLERREVSRPLAIGSSIHNGLDASLTDWKNGNRDIERLIRVASTAVGQTFQDYCDHPDLLIDALADVNMVEGVAQAAIAGWWRLIERTGFPFGQVVDVERTIPSLTPEETERLPERWRWTSSLAGKLDLELLDDEGQSSIGEHKSRSSLSFFDGWFHYLDMDFQALFYLLLSVRDATLTGDPSLAPRSFWYNAIVKDAHRTPKDYQELFHRRLSYMEDEPAKYFLQKKVVVEPGMLQFYADHLRLIVDRVREANTEICFHWNPKACDSYGTACAYRPLCSRGCTVSNTDEVLQMVDWDTRYYVVEPNVELSTANTDSDA